MIEMRKAVEGAAARPTESRGAPTPAKGGMGVIEVDAERKVVSVLLADEALFEALEEVFSPAAPAELEEKVKSICVGPAEPREGCEASFAVSFLDEDGCEVAVIYFDLKSRE